MSDWLDVVDGLSDPPTPPEEVLLDQEQSLLNDFEIETTLMTIAVI